MAIKDRPPFDPKSFLAMVGEGRGIGEYHKGEIDPADAVFYIQSGWVAEFFSGCWECRFRSSSCLRSSLAKWSDQGDGAPPRPRHRTRKPMSVSLFTQTCRLSRG